MKKIRQRSILAHIRQVVILGIILLVVALELSSVVSIQKALSNDIRKEISSQAESSSEYVNSWLSRKVSETEVIAASVQKFEDFSDEYIEEYLSKCAEVDADVLNYYLCRDGIQYVVYNGGIFELDPTERSWWKDAWNAVAEVTQTIQQFNV